MIRISLSCNLVSELRGGDLHAGFTVLLVRTNKQYKNGSMSDLFFPGDIIETWLHVDAFLFADGNSQSEVTCSR